MSQDLSVKEHDTDPQSSTRVAGDDDGPTTSARRGRLVVLRTKAEHENSGLQSIPAYVVEIPRRSASQVLKEVDALLREHDQDPINLQHLRRIVKTEHLPLHLRQNTNNARFGRATLDFPEAPSISPADLNDTDAIEVIASEQIEPSLHLLVSSIRSLTFSNLFTLLTSLFPSKPPVIQSLPVPRYPPTSSLEAQEWSQEYWPTVYRKYNPFGPQPITITKAEAEIQPKVGRWMGLATKAGRDAEAQGTGAAIGTAVVENGKLVALAGDGRWASGKFDVPDGEESQGNPMAHAVMRAIGLVARKRRDLNVQQSALIGEGARQKGSADTERTVGDHFFDKPLTELELRTYEDDSITAGGYLCVDMDIYVTHEPCVMCSMAILHSRFGRVVFGQRMGKTGGMCAGMDVKGAVCSDECGRGEVESALGYGLFWRQELNWRLLAWQWVDEDDSTYPRMKGDTHHHASDHYHLRMHRARSVILTDEELVEIRAAQRTFEGAYIRTALGQFSFALVILKIFTSEFYSIGALFAIYGSGILFTSLLRRQQGNKQFFSEIGEDGLNQKKFRTSGNVVVVLTALSVAAYACLLGLTLRLGD
ncbi:MAG: hypothetical protein Q9170_000824 [Blastenia crenularia]